MRAVQLKGNRYSRTGYRSLLLFWDYDNKQVVVFFQAHNDLPPQGVTAPSPKKTNRCPGRVEEGFVPRNEHRKKGRGRAHCTKNEGKCVSPRVCVRDEGTVGTPAAVLPIHIPLTPPLTR